MSLLPLLLTGVLSAFAADKPVCDAKEEYLSSIKDLKQWRNNLIVKQTPPAGPLCADRVVVGEKEAANIICLTGMDRKDKMGFFRWVRGQTNLVSGRY